jgi:SpoVK/Ycf46/Vps4 family AAA+-type ATPase
LAKALAAELNFPYVILSGSDVTSKWVNESSEKVRMLFEEAVELADTADGAVIFLDELDAVLPERQMDSHEENRKVVNEFLNRLQESGEERVLFIGATHRRDDLDSAATRNGRIDKEIFVGRPDRDTRVKIFRTQLKGRPHSLDDSDLRALAEATDGLVAADIESIVNQAA